MASIGKPAARVDHYGTTGDHKPVINEVVGPSEGHESHFRHGDLKLFDEGVVQFHDLNLLQWVGNARHLVCRLGS